MKQEITCIFSLFNMSWSKKRTNELIQFIYERNISVNEFFQIEKMQWEIFKKEFEFSLKEIQDLKKAKESLVSNSFFLEKLLSEGVEILPFTSEEYPKSLKENLELKNLPTLLFCKGNLELLKKRCVSIVGSRSAKEISLEFTRKIAQIEAGNKEVIVSGFAKGVDREAFEATIEYGGKTIIVLPQGILTFKLPKEYYSYYTKKQILIMSTYPPNSTWNTGYAMERNNYIYALGSQIYVAESDSKGGTWNGVIEGLKKGRKILVRIPQDNEVNANEMLIAKGAKAIDMDGSLVNDYVIKNKQIINPMEIEEDIKKILLSSEKPISIEMIFEKIDNNKYNISLNSIRNVVKKIENIEFEKRKGRNFYYIGKGLKKEENKKDILNNGFVGSLF